MDLSSPTPISLEQVPQVHALIDRCYREHGLVLNLADECEGHLLNPGEYFRSTGGEFWIVTDARGSVVATVALDGEHGELKSMYVDAAYRRRGLGRTMTLMVMAEARNRGHGELVLWSDTRFAGAHAMYESLGFERSGARDVADSNNTSEYGFRMPLCR